MSRHTSFRIGGPADALLAPRTLEELARVFALVLEEGIPHFILGSGANILVSDQGIRGIVIDMTGIGGCSLEADGTLLAALAGTEVQEVCQEALRLELSGIEFLSYMPGSLGGSIWMNARCYGSSISEVLEWVDILDESARLVRIEIEEPFPYKRSPFQDRRVIICRGGFRLRPGKTREIRRKMSSIREDREHKGHFIYPSAGSVFKNRRELGRPTGEIIDSLGLKGRSIGGARISERHANIIVNTGGARAAEVLELIRLVEQEVKRRLGLKLDREILLVGEW